MGDGCVSNLTDAGVKASLFLSRDREHAKNFVQKLTPATSSFWNENENFIRILQEKKERISYLLCGIYSSILLHAWSFLAQHNTTFAIFKPANK